MISSFPKSPAKTKQQESHPFGVALSFCVGPRTTPFANLVAFVTQLDVKLLGEILFVFLAKDHHIKLIVDLGHPMRIYEISFWPRKTA